MKSSKHKIFFFDLNWYDSKELDEERTITMSNIQIPVSVLNLVPIRKGQEAKDAIDSMVDLAQATEKWVTHDIGLQSTIIHQH